MKILSEAAQRIGQFLQEQGYTEENLSRLEIEGCSLSNQDLPLPAEPIIHDGDSLLELLRRLFSVGQSVSISQGEKFLPKKVLRSFLAIGLLEGMAISFNRLAS